MLIILKCIFRKVRHHMQLFTCCILHLTTVAHLELRFQLFNSSQHIHHMLILERCHQRGLIYAENKSLGSLWMMCNPFFHEFQVSLQAHRFQQPNSQIPDWGISQPTPAYGCRIGPPPSSQVCRYDNPVPELTLSPSQGSINSATARLLDCYLIHHRGLTLIGVLLTLAGGEGQGT